MAKLFAVSQSSMLLLDFQSQTTISRPSSGVICSPRSATAFHHNAASLSRNKLGPLEALLTFPSPAQLNPGGFWERIGAISVSRVGELKCKSEQIDVEPAAGSGGSFGDDGKGIDDHSSGGGGGGDDDYKGSGNQGPNDDNSGSDRRLKALSMSQKLTLGYAALVGLGGVLGYIKTGSQKSLAAGGTSALVLYFVYTQLPIRPVLASSIGLGLSAALLFVMGSRFKRSGKIFPAGVVSLVSLIMTGGYLHGIMRTMH